MAVTKIHAITATVDKAVAYICNPDKTDESIYISSYACAPEIAASMEQSFKIRQKNRYFAEYNISATQS